MFPVASGGVITLLLVAASRPRSTLPAAGSAAGSGAAPAPTAQGTGDEDLSGFPRSTCPDRSARR
jgi:hypothetical protein